MSLISAIFSTFLEAMFPTPAAEQEVLAMGPAGACRALPRAAQFPIDEACSIFAYKDERVSRLIWAIKYKKSPAAAAIAGFALHRILRIYASVGPQIIVVPMPITRKRRRERGYNQCELILDEIEKLESKRDVDADPKPLASIRDLLVRVRHTSRQTLKDRAERLESAEDIFAVDENAAQRLMSMLGSTRDTDLGTEGSHDHLVIVIDDVVTTGSTMRDAIRTLRQTGFPNTFGLSVAH